MLYIRPILRSGGMADLDGAYVIACSIPATFDGVTIVPTQQYVMETGTPVNQLCIYVGAGNDFTVNAHYPAISDGTGAQSEFYYKQDGTMSDTDPTTVSYASPVIDDPENPGAC